MSSEPICVRQATMGDYDALVALFDELDEFHRLARPEVFRPFDGPARTREHIEQWLTGPGSTVLVAVIDREVVGLAVLLMRPPSPFAGAVPLRVIELDNLVVHSGLRSRGVGRRLIEATVGWSQGQGGKPCRRLRACLQPRRPPVLRESRFSTFDRPARACYVTFRTDQC